MPKKTRPVPRASRSLPSSGERRYGALLEELKERIRAAQVRAVRAVNRELVGLYWQIGRDILARQGQEGWGSGVVTRLAADLRREFPEMRGLSRTNLAYMRAFAEAWPDDATVLEPLGNLPWGHNVVLLDRLCAADERLWYARQAVVHGWSRTVLLAQIDNGLFARQGRAITNFHRTLPAAQSELARELMKDPYCFDFLALAPDAQERDLERALLAHVRDFLLELGVGFALVGSQYRMEVGGQEFVMDLLFFHIHLRCFVVVDLKVGSFKPEYAGKMGFYLTAVDEVLRGDDHHPTLGLILCRERNRVVVEYALRGSGQPIGVALYSSTGRLPQRLKGSLPSVAQLQRGLASLEGARKHADDA